MNAHSKAYSSIRAGNLAWVAPECISGPEGFRVVSSRPTPQVDVWSFGHVCLEVLCIFYVWMASRSTLWQLYLNQNPYDGITNDVKLAKRILSPYPVCSPLNSPPRFFGPTTLPDWRMPRELWDVVSRCWMTKDARPTSSEIVDRLQALAPKTRLP